MPLYEYRCAGCNGLATQRRLFSEMDTVLLSECCGTPLERQFTPNGNIIIPIHFKQWQANGAPGGGQLSWSDFHEVSEKELARDEGVESTNSVRSRPGFGRQKARS